MSAEDPTPRIEVQVSGEAIIRIGREAIRVAPVRLRVFFEPNDTVDLRWLVGDEVRYRRKLDDPGTYSRWKDVIAALLRTDRSRRGDAVDKN